MATFSALLALCAGNSAITGELPSQRPVARSFDIFFICAWINGWANNREAGDLRRHRAHYDVIVMMQRMRAQNERWPSSVLKKVSVIELSMKTSVSLNEGPSYFPRRVPRYTQTCASWDHMPLGCWTLRLRSARVAIWWEYSADDFSLCCEMSHTVMKSECLW